LVQFFQEFDAMPKLRHGKQAAFDRQSLGKAQASAGCFPLLYLNSQPCWRGKGIVSFGECRTIGQQLADFVRILDETSSVRFWMIQDTIYQS